MKKKDSIVFLVQRTKTTVAISSFLFLLGSLIADLNMGGVYSARLFRHQNGSRQLGDRPRIRPSLYHLHQRKAKPFRADCDSHGDWLRDHVDNRFSRRLDPDR